jgi:arrestin-related trafficking adapter 4/5/7
LAEPDADGRIPAGNYEWPFELLIPGDTPETTKGCSRCSIAYYLKADTIREKPGAVPQSFRGIRIMRTLPTADFEMMDATTVQSKCEDALSYTVSVSHRAVALGTSVPVEVDVALPGPGWRAESIVSRLVEVHELDSSVVSGHGGYSGVREVLSWDLLEIHGWKDSMEKEPEERLCIVEEVPLPQEARHCSPDVDALGIRVTHVLDVDFVLENGEGGVIKVRCGSRRYPETRLTATASCTDSHHLIRVPGHAHQRHGPLRQNAISEPSKHLRRRAGTAAVWLPLWT